MIGSLRVRLAILSAVVIVAIGATAAYVIGRHDDQVHTRSTASPVAQASLTAIQNEPHIVFRSTALRTGYGQVAMVALADPSGPRAFTRTACDRVYSTTAHLICLSSDPGVVTTYAAHVLDARTQRATQTLQLTGIPSRARLSADGTLAATTSFVSGDSYASTSFSTRTVITRVGGATYGSLESFTLIHRGAAIAPADRNFWGVTFASDDRTFYATAAWAGHTWLARGDLTTRRLTTLHEDAECPSLSPDGKTVVFKERAGQPAGHWRLAAYTVATGRVKALAEKHSVDDQVEWLNSSTVIYGLPRTGSQAAIDDVWAVPADGSGKATLLIPQAWSPSVVR